MADRNVVTLKCTECHDQNYFIDRGKKKGDRTKIEVRKFCPRCGRHAPHKEGKLSKG